MGELSHPGLWWGLFVVLHATENLLRGRRGEASRAVELSRRESHLPMTPILNQTLDLLRSDSH
jgi:hypothetical protein